MNLGKGNRNPLKMGIKPVSENKKNYILKKSLPQSVEVHHMISKRAVRIAFMAFMLVSSALVIFVPQPAEAGLVTIVTSNILADSDTVDVSPGSPGQIGFTGKVTVTNYNTAVPCIVSLNVQSTVGQATIDKPQMVFQGGTQEDVFHVLCQVPPITTLRQPAQVLVSGTWQQGATTGTIGTSQAPFLVDQFQLMTVYSTNPVIETGPGTRAVFAIRIENTGNYKDEFKIEIPNRDKLEKKGFIIPQLPKTWIELGDPAPFTLPIQLPHDWTIWTDTPETIWISVISTSSGDLVKEDYPLILRIRGIYIPGFEPVMVIMGLAFMAVILKKRQSTMG
jgi:hypothetical protein